MQRYQQTTDAQYNIDRSLIYESQAISLMKY